MTNQPQHTQGPWYAHTTFISGETDNIAIAQCSYRGPVDLDEAQANAQLIASAPDMLLALGTVLETFEWAKREGGNQYRHAVEDLTHVVKAAIAKAKGETTNAS